MSKKKNKKVSEGDENNNKNDVEEKNKEENDGDNKNVEDEGKKDGTGGGNGKDAVVLKIDLHCEGCASKVIKRIRSFAGVVDVEVDGGSNKLSVFGKVDPVKLRDALVEKLHKRVEVISPVPKKDGKSKDNGGGDGKDEKEKDSNDKKNKINSDEKKSKEPHVTTAVLKVPLHCEGCIQKIHKIITKAKGYQEMKLDRQKDMVTVTGAIDMKALKESLKKHLKKNVEIVPPNKAENKDNEKEKENGNGACGGSSQGKGGGGGGGNGNGNGNGNGKGDSGDGEERMDIENKMQVQHGYGHPVMPYGHVPPLGDPHGPMMATGYMTDPYQQFSYHAPQIFSDENPNACSVM